MFVKILPSVLAVSCSLSLLCLLGCSRGNQVMHSTQQDIASITAVSKARADAFSHGNAARIAVHFTEDALLMAPDKPTQIGKAELLPAYLR